MRTFLTALILASSAAAQAHATPVTVEYTAVINKMYVRPLDSANVSVQNNDFAGFNISVGQTVIGTFSYDSETKLALNGSDQLGYEYMLDGAHFRQTLKFENSQNALTFDVGEDLTTSAYNDPYVIWTEGSPDDTYAATLQGHFEHPTVDTIAEGYLPAPNQWSGFGGNSYIRFWQWSRQDPSLMNLTANITSFRVVSAVPEPSIYLMLGAGLGMIGLARRSRRMLAIAQAK